ncbi:MAG: alpha/beta hydrolase [Thermaerobacter sp.]|nr:alpha/beta hydrolase [Thermaerobacter sp.]
MRLEVAGEEIEAYGDVGGRCLLVHGAGEDAQLFAAQLRDVKGTWAVDLPGHGASPGSGREHVEEYRDLVLALLERYAKKPPVLGGHSMGGAIALACALFAQDSLAGLALIATGGRLRVHPDLSAALETSDIMPPAFRTALVAPGRGEDLLGALSLPKPGVLRKDFLACNRFDVLARLPEIRLRTLVLVGSLDAYTPEKYARALAQALGGELIVVPEAGHTLPLEAPQAVSQALARFLSEG